ncbi:MAG: AMP-dependent synthetase and ligase [Ilumatobacteraceae bacterium]|nr:AMP-dependent synthetase and ligase [Ilumatobacteraceae bacterium]
MNGPNAALIDSARGMTLGDQLARQARINPELVAYRCGDASQTFAETEARVARLAAAFEARGITAGDRIAILMHNAIAFVEAFWTAARLGAIAVPINFRLAADEVGYIVDDCAASMIVVDAANAAVASTVLGPRPDVAVVVTDAAPIDVSPRAERMEQLIADHAPAQHRPLVALDDPAFIIYTSGTTGRPKGAVLSHANLLHNTYTKIATHGITGQGEVWMSGLSLCHIAGVSSLLPCLLLGGTCVVMPSGQFDATEMVDVIEAEGVTCCFLVPTQWKEICAVPDVGRRCRSLRQIAWGGSNAPMAVLESMAAAFPGVATFNTFGQTEMSPLTCVLRGADAIRKMGSVGTPVPNVEVRIVDDDMVDVADGDVGEIVYRGPTVMLGYWNDPAATEDAFAGGWFHSGDLVRRDADGFITVIDRKKDMIISGGENIYCAEVEAVIVRHPAVDEVALVGIPHPRWVETPVAVIVPAAGVHPPTLDDITGWCRDHLASYKKPTQVVIVEALPRNASAKVLKHLLREQLTATLDT